MTGSGGDVTRLLAQLREGNQEAADRLVPLVYDELRRMAASYMQRERPGHTLPATALVHEAYMRLLGQQPGQNRAHFFAIAADTMRQVLLDFARRHHAGKRGGAGARKVDLDGELLVSHDALEDVIAIDEASNGWHRSTRGKAGWWNCASSPAWMWRRQRKSWGSRRPP